MKNRSIMVILVTCLVLSVGFNIVLFQKNNKLITKINSIQNNVTEENLDLMKQEIDRLSQQKYTNDLQYNIKTKQPIINKF